MSIPDVEIRVKGDLGWKTNFTWDSMENNSLYMVKDA